MKNVSALQDQRNSGVIRSSEQRTTTLAGYWIFGLMSWAGFLFLWTLIFARFLVPQ